MSLPIFAGSLRDRSDQVEPTDTVSGFRTVAEKRWEDGMALLEQSGFETASVYMMGYAVELVLKVALCEMLGVPPSADPWPHFWAAGFRPNDVKTHDLSVLWAQVRSRRESFGFDIRDPAFHGALEYYVSAVHTNWWAEMRYRNENATPTEAADVSEASFWLLTRLEEIYH